MTNVGYATLTIIPSAKGFQKALSGQVDPASKASGKGAGAALGGGILGGLAAIAPAAAAALGVAGIVAGFRSAISAASDLGESVNAVNVIFGDAADEVLALGQNAARAVGLSNSQFNGLAVQFSAFSKTIAGAGGDVVGVLGDLTGRAADFASVMNLDVSEAATLFQSGLAGETEPLRRYGIDLSAAAVAAYAYANGIATAGSELTEAQKVQARYGLLMQATAATSGDFANTQFSLANGLRILGASWEDVQAKLGQGLLPFAAASVAGINALMPALSSFAQGFADFGARMQAIYDEAGGGADGFRAMVESIGTSIAEFFTGGGLLSALEGLSDARAGFFSAIQNALPGILDGLVEFLPQLATYLAGTFIPAFVTQFAGLATSLVETLAVALPQIVNALAGLLPQLITTLVGMLPTLLGTALGLFMALVSAITTTIPLVITALVDMLPGIVSTLVGMLPEIVGGALALFLGLVQGLVDAIPVLLVAILGALPSILETILGMLPSLIEAAFGLFFGLVFGLLDMLPDLIRTLLVDVLPALLTTLAKMLPQLIQGAVDLFSGLVTGLAENVPLVVNEIIRMIPLIVGALLEATPQLFQAGVAILRGLIDGLVSMAGAVGKTLLGIIEGAVGGVLDFLGINSPSRLFREIGGFTAEGMALGIEDGAKRVAKASDALIPTAPKVPPAPLGAGESVVGALAAAGAGAGGLTFTYTQVGGQGLTSEQEVERAARRLKQSIRK